MSPEATTETETSTASVEPVGEIKSTADTSDIHVPEEVQKAHRKRVEAPYSPPTGSPSIAQANQHGFDPTELFDALFDEFKIDWDLAHLPLDFKRHLATTIIINIYADFTVFINLDYADLNQLALTFGVDFDDSEYKKLVKAITDATGSHQIALILKELAISCGKDTPQSVIFRIIDDYVLMAASEQSDRTQYQENIDGGASGNVPTIPIANVPSNGFGQGQVVGPADSLL